jgi:MarR family transcriptional regulator, lower aerobic nicotinate degradation pathway regulator
MGSHTIARSVMDSLRRLVYGLRVFDRAAERATGLSGAQLFVLGRLAAGACSVNELAERTHTHQSSVSVVARKLVDRGLASHRRAKQDARRAELAVTPAGRRALANAPAAAQDKLIASVEKMSARDRRNLYSSLEQLVRAAGLDAGRPALFFEDTRHNRKPTSHARKRN